MDKVYWMSLGAGVLARAACGAGTLWRHHNSPNAERYRRTAMQGRFAPLSDQDLAAAEKRQSGRV